MKKSRFSEKLIIGILREAEAGNLIKLAPPFPGARGFGTSRHKEPCPALWFNFDSHPPPDGLCFAPQCPLEAVSLSCR